MRVTGRIWRSLFCRVAALPYPAYKLLDAVFTLSRRRVWVNREVFTPPPPWRVAVGGRLKTPFPNPPGKP
ncbi:hypothetical protein FJMB80014_33750 [Enterobacter hormaechei]|nr:hypothetical protein FJMB80014_33750 [Enterobacter hormaechei]